MLHFQPSWVLVAFCSLSRIESNLALKFVVTRFIVIIAIILITIAIFPSSSSSS
jgi:hypothetical protein